MGYDWSADIDETGDDSNIFGKNTCLRVDIDDGELTVPVNEATKENVAYFGCLLVDANDTFPYEVPEQIPNLPMTKMSVGPTYAEEYIYTGSGAYLEWHDVPHFHMPLNERAGGHLVIGVVSEDSIKLTGFKIPFGKAIYMAPYTLHNDCFVVGDYGCVYAATTDFCTGTVFNNKKENIHFKFV